MTSTLTTSSAIDVIALCDQGIYEPWHGTAPIDLLARGIVESATGDLETAKDLLSQAHWSLEGEWKDRAGVQLAVAYWRGGEKSEAWALLDTLPAGFDVLLTQAIIKTDADPSYALEILSRAEAYDVSRYKWGRLHNQRGMCFRLLGKCERAREEYEAALYFLRDCPLRSLVENNLGGVLDACASHGAVDTAIASLSGPHLGQAYERKADLLYHEDKLDRAGIYATWAIDLLDAADRRLWLIDALRTRARIFAAQENYGDAISDLTRAYGTAEYLGDGELKFVTAGEIHALAKKTSKIYHCRSVRLALDTSPSLNSAASKLGISRQGLQDFMRSNRLTSKFSPRRTIITK